MTTPVRWFTGTLKASEDGSTGVINCIETHFLFKKDIPVKEEDFVKLKDLVEAKVQFQVGSVERIVL